MTQVTRWFPAKTKPDHIGAYEVTEESDDIEWFSWWDGKRWNGQWGSVERAEMHRYFGDTTPTKRWRGLSEPSA